MGIFPTDVELLEKWIINIRWDNFWPALRVMLFQVRSIRPKMEETEKILNRGSSIPPQGEPEEKPTAEAPVFVQKEAEVFPLLEGEIGILQSDVESETTEEAVKAILDTFNGHQFNVLAADTLLTRPEQINKLEYAVSLIKSFRNVLSMHDIRVSDRFFIILRTCFHNLTPQQANEALDFHYKMFERDGKSYVPSLPDWDLRRYDTYLWKQELPEKLNGLQKDFTDDKFGTLLTTVAWAAMLNVRLTLMGLLSFVIEQPDKAVGFNCADLFCAILYRLPAVTGLLLQKEELSVLLLAVFLFAKNVKLEYQHRNYGTLLKLMSRCCLDDSYTPALLDANAFIQRIISVGLSSAQKDVFLTLLKVLFSDAKISLKFDFKSDPSTDSIAVRQLLLGLVSCMEEHKIITCKVALALSNRMDVNQIEQSLEIIQTITDEAARKLMKIFRKKKASKEKEIESADGQPNSPTPGS